MHVFHNVGCCFMIFDTLTVTVFSSSDWCVTVSDSETYCCGFGGQASCIARGLSYTGPDTPCEVILVTSSNGTMSCEGIAEESGNLEDCGCDGEPSVVFYNYVVIFISRHACAAVMLDRSHLRGRLRPNTSSLLRILCRRTLFLNIQRISSQILRPPLPVPLRHP